LSFRGEAVVTVITFKNMEIDYKQGQEIKVVSEEENLRVRLHFDHL
jgi:hypothetical protein